MMQSEVRTIGIRPLKPLPGSIDQLTGLDDVLRRRGATGLAYSCDELFELDDRMLRLNNADILVFRYEDLRALGAMPTVANVPYRTYLDRVYFEPFGIPPDDPEFRHLRRLPVNSMFSALPPVHDAIKPTFARPLMPKAMPAFEQAALVHSQELVSKFAGVGEIEFAEDFGQTVAFAVWGQLLGMSETERDELRLVMKDMWPVVSPGRQLDKDTIVALNQGVKRYYGILNPAIRRACDASKGDFVQSMGRQYASVFGVQDMPESMEAMVSTSLLDAFHALGAGIAGAVYAMLSDPDLHQAVRDDANLADNAVAEGLRLYAPVRMIMRYAMEDIFYNGLKIPAGTRLALNWGAGGRDPAVYEDPLKLRLARPQIASQTFGAGGQICPGRNVVRSISTVVLQVLTQPGVHATLVGEPRWFSADPITFNTHPLSVPVAIERV